MLSPSTARILVVDPDEHSRILYRDCLAPAGCDTIEALDGRDALVKALVHAPVLVVTEVPLPHIDGLALCEILRKDRVTRNTAILVITADARPDIIDKARRAGADAVLVKPVSPETVFAYASQVMVRDQEPRSRAGDRHDGASQEAQQTAVGREAAVALMAIGRATTTPPATPPDLHCPSCNKALTYVRSFLGGRRKRDAEQWDYYTCTACGTFQYRQRTRKLRRVS